MIKCKLDHLRKRCEERGVGLSDAASCIVSQDGDDIVVDENHPSYPRPRPGLGDMVSAGLDAIGITKERVSAIVGGDCGCTKRQEALNEFGRFFGMG